jgi:hypothetical protein
MWTALLSLCILTSDVPNVQVIDLDDATPHHVVVIVDGEPFKATTVPIGAFPVPPAPDPAPTPSPVPDKPKPITGTLWVTYIVPTAMTEADAAPVRSPLIDPLLVPGSVEWRYQTAGDAEITRRKFQQYTAMAPVTVFQGPDGKVLKTLRGNDPQTIVNTIHAFKGVTK